MESCKRNHEEVESNTEFSENSKIRKISDSADLKQSLADPDYVFTENVQQPQYTTESQNNQRARIVEIIKKEFNTEVMHKEREIDEINDRLKIAMKTLQLLRSVCTSAFYNRKELVTSSFNDAELKINDPSVDTVFGSQTRPHPAVKKIIGKAPLQLTPTRTRQVRRTHTNLKNGYVNDEIERNETIPNEPIEKNNDNDNERTNFTQEPMPSTSRCTDTTIINQYKNDTAENGGIRNERFKTKHTIIIGNISKWLNPSNTNPDKSTHKWMVYVRGPKEQSDISHIVKKVRFFLHPSYRPNDIIEIKSPPFHLSRRGWGEFPLRVQIHFTNNSNKPIDIIHNLKLDRTHTGLETLGAETVINVWLYTKPLNDISTLITDKNHLEKNFNFNEIINLNDELDDSDGSNDSDDDVDNKDSIYQCDEQTIKIDNDFMSIQQESIDSINIDNIPNSSKSTTFPESQQVFPTIPSTNQQIPVDNENCTPNSLSKPPDLNKTLPTTSGKIYFKDGKICVMKNRTRVAPVKQKHISLLKSLPMSSGNKFDEKTNLDNNLILVTVRGINEIHDYCKKIVNNSNSNSISINSYDYFLLKFSKLKFTSMVTALLYLLRHLPLINLNAREPLYLKMFPYTAATLKEFLSWNKAKQCCSEWYRAKFIKNLLDTNKIIDHEKWSTKSIVKFSRMAGFGINFELKENDTPQKTIPHNKNHQTRSLNTFTECDELKDYLKQTTYSTVSDDVEINVVDDEIPHIDKKIKEEPIPSENIVYFTNKDTKSIVSSDFIKNIVSELGISLGLEEIIPDHWTTVSEICILVATKCLVEDLIRRSLLISSSTCDKSNEVKLEHVKSALLARPEFDIFLNYGLGKRY